MSGDEPLPPADVLEHFRKFWADLGINSTNIDSGITTFEIQDTQEITFGNRTFPMFIINDVPLDYTIPCKEIQSQGLDPSIMYQYSPEYLHSEFRDANDNYAIYSDTEGFGDMVNMPGKKLFDIDLGNELIITVGSYWTSRNGAFNFYIWNVGNNLYEQCNDDFLYYDYYTNWLSYSWWVTWYGFYANQHRHLGIVGYDTVLDKLYYYIYLVDVFNNHITSIMRFPLNAEPTGGSNFDNSDAGISDYTIIGGDLVFDIPNLDAPLDRPLEDVLNDAGYTIEADTGVVEPAVGTVDTMLYDTIFTAITDAMSVPIEVTIPDTITQDAPNPDIPEKVRKFKLPNLIITKFPFCLPWDMIALFQMINTPPISAPVIDLSFDWQFSNYTDTFPLIIDMELLGISRIAKLTKWMTLFMWIFFLITITRKMTLS